MKETKPLFIIKKYRSILRAAIIVEAVNFLVSLTDGVIAGNAVGAEAFAAIGLLAPFLSVSTFLASIVNSGTVLNFSYQVGKFDKRRANEFFSEGVITAFLLGTLYSFTMLLLGPVIIRNLSPTQEINQYLNEYFYIILLFYFLQPISYLFDNMLVADGGEKLSVVANATLIASNIVLSILFVKIWDIKGIAIATVLSKVLFILMICLHFLSKKNTLKFVRHWKMKDLFSIFRKGIVKASTYGLEAALFFCINLFAIRYFDADTLVILVVVERFLGLFTLFVGLSMACQPLVGTLRGENNTYAQLVLMKTVLCDMIIVSGILSLIVFFGAPLITTLFGITGGEVYYQTISALRILSSTLVLQAVLVLFFLYYVFIEKQLLAFFICLIKNFICPIIFAVVLAILLRSQSGIWIGLASAPVLAVLISCLIVYLKYGKKSFPFLISEDRDQKIYIYDFVIDSENAVRMSATVQNILRKNSISTRTSVFAGIITEDVLLLVKDKNKTSKKTICAECTLIIQKNGVKLIIRDSGVIFDITDTDGDVDSFRKYIVSNLMLNMNNSLYMITTGYNRSEFFFDA